MVHLFSPDVNVVHRMKEPGGAAGLDELAARAGAAMGITTHFVYELARGYLHDRHVETVRRAFGFLAESKTAQYLAQAGTLLRAELEEADRGVSVIACCCRSAGRRKYGESRE